MLVELFHSIKQQIAEIKPEIKNKAIYDLKEWLVIVLQQNGRTFALITFEYEKSHYMSNIIS